MYQSQIAGLKQDIIQNGGFEGCQVSGDYNGIQIKGVRKIPDSINQGRHCCFVDLENYRGAEYFCLLNNSLRYGFTKPINEVAAHVDIYGSSNSLRLIGSNQPNVFSQKLSGLSANHTVYGHSSFYIYAIKSATNQQPEPSVNEATKTIEQIEELLNKLKGLVK